MRSNAAGTPSCHALTVLNHDRDLVFTEQDVRLAVVLHEQSSLGRKDHPLTHIDGWTRRWRHRYLANTFRTSPRVIFVCDVRRALIGGLPRFPEPLRSTA